MADAIPATPANFSAAISANSAAAASAPSSAPASSPAPSAPTSLPHPGSTAAVPVQPPANTNAAPQEPANTQTATEQPAAAPADAGAAPVEAAPDPWAEELHGVNVRDLVDAVRNGELPESVLQGVMVGVKVNGQEMRIPLREAANGYMRIRDYTQGTMQLAAQQQQLEIAKQRLASLFAGWDKPGDAFNQSIDRMGLTGHVRQMVSKNWGTTEKPNVEGFMEDLRRMGHFNTFRAAANAYAADYARRINQYNPLGEQYQAQIAATKDPNVRQRLIQEAQMLEQQAMQMFQQYETDMDSMWSQRVAAETEAEATRREREAAQRALLLQQQQMQPQQQQLDPRMVAQHVSKIRDENFAKLGVQLKTTQERVTAMKYFDENMDAFIYLASRDGGTEPIESIVAKAVEETARSMQLHRPAGAAPNAAPAAAPQQQAAQPPSPKPGGAPTTTAAAVAGRTAADFERLAWSGWKTK